MNTPDPEPAPRDPEPSSASVAQPESVAQQRSGAQQESGTRRSLVRTVAGDLDPAELGSVNYHEHLFQVTDLLPGDELDDEAASGTEAEGLLTSGFDAMIDATPYGLGRRPAAVARISARTGLHVVAATGLHREDHYRNHPAVLALDTDAMIRIMLGELTEGQRETDSPAHPTAASPLATGPQGAPVRAGIIKTGIGYWSISDFEHRVLTAAAVSHRDTGAPIMVHLEHGTCAHEVLDLLAGLGVAEHRVVLAHIDRSPDPILYGELAARGAHLGCDGAARLKDWPESLLIDAIAAAVDAGHGEKILLGGDVARRSRYRAYGGIPGLAYLGDRFVPRLRTRIGDAATEAILTDNAQRVLTWQR